MPGWLAGILLYAACRGLLLMHALPRWQGADEPSHAEMAILVGREGWPGEPSAGVQSAIVEDMGASRFDAWLGQRSPSVPRATFAQVPRLADAPHQVGDETPIGYLGLALAGRLARPAGDPAAWLWAMRLAALAQLLAWILALAWAGRRLGGPGWARPLVISAALIPPAAMAGATVSPDLVPAILVALWLGLGTSTAAGARGWLLAALAAAGKRSALFMLPLTLLATLRRRRPPSVTIGGEGRRRLHGLLVAGAALALLVALPRSGEASGWRREGRAWGAERLREAARAGGHGLRVRDDSSREWQYLRRWVDLPEDAARAGPRRVEVGVWVRSAAGPGGAAQLAVTDGQGRWWGDTAAVGGAWTRLETTFDLPAAARGLRVALVPGSGTAEGTGAFDFDDLELRVDGRPMEVNGGAESPRRWGMTGAAALARYLDPGRLGAGVAAAALEPGAALATAGGGLAFLSRSHWGGLGWLKVWPGPVAGALGQLLSLWIAAAVVLALLRPSALAAEGPERERLRFLASGALLAVLIAAAGSMLGAEDRLPQGRYLLPAWPFLAVPALALASRLSPARGPRTFCLTLLALDLWGLFGLLWPAYAGRP